MFKFPGGNFLPQPRDFRQQILRLSPAYLQAYFLELFHSKFSFSILLLFCFQYAEINLRKLNYCWRKSRVFKILVTFKVWILSQLLRRHKEENFKKFCRKSLEALSGCCASCWEFFESCSFKTFSSPPAKLFRDLYHESFEFANESELNILQFYNNKKSTGCKTL